MKQVQSFFNSKNLKAILLLSFMLLPNFIFADVGDDLQQLYDQEIKPILNVVVSVVVAVAAVWAGIQFFMGKREALKTFGYILLGALVIRFLPEIVLAFMGS